ncbi:alpha-hydroxy acid oxidase [Variovorax sp. LT1R16]|uniref:alpha-hydroxy acid oxidase n=1 Tax=Variovorax sp. LT1R16 TaxID=3443728 RepID=UPI003F4687E4
MQDLREMALQRLPRAVFDFFDGGAEDECTLRDNRHAFERMRLVPRVLVDVSNVDLGTTIVGAPAAAPMLIAPTGAIGAGWPQADLAIARAAAKAGLPYTLSTTATSSIEAIAEGAGGRLWFQLYVLRDRDFTNRLMARARDAGYEALVVTLDLQTGGKRERDLRNGFTVPLRPSWRLAADFLGHPVWLWHMLRAGAPRFENLDGLEGMAAPDASIAAKVGQNLDAGFDWQALRRLREAWPRKLIVKGVLRGDDAQQLAELGVDAIWVSNHGGRQLDGSVAAVDALTDVVSAVGSRIPVILDSGVRRGSDVLKAVASGAQAVAMGRATLYGASAAGEAGAARALEILQEELRRAMQLCGVPRIAELGPDILRLPTSSGKGIR